MIHKNGQLLTPATKETATRYNYTWYNGKGRYPDKAGFVFPDKESIAEQIYRDFPNGVALSIDGEPEHVGEGTVIGGPGFGWYGDPPKRFPHVGGIRFGVGVEIGANSTIDRGAIGDTIIEDYVKIDNGVHVGHNVRIGRASILTAHCNIGGSVTIGQGAWIGLGAQIKNQLYIGAGAIVGMGAIVVRDVPTGITVVGNPARKLK